MYHSIQSKETIKKSNFEIYDKQFRQIKRLNKWTHHVLILNC